MQRMECKLDYRIVGNSKGRRTYISQIVANCRMGQGRTVLSDMELEVDTLPQVGSNRKKRWERSTRVTSSYLMAGNTELRAKRTFICLKYTPRALLHFCCLSETPARQRRQSLVDFPPAPR